MSPTVATALIGGLTLLATTLALAAGALWRLGSKVGSFEASVVAACNAAQAAKQAAGEAQAAAQRAAADAVAAARLLYDEMRKTVRDFQCEIEDVKHELAETKGRWREAHTLADQVNDHETRLSVLEREHERNHPEPMISARHQLPPNEEAIPLPPGVPEELIDGRSGGHRSGKGGRR